MSARRPPALSEDERAAFAAAVADVRPLEPDARQRPARPPARSRRRHRPEPRRDGTEPHPFEPPRSEQSARRGARGQPARQLVRDIERRRLRIQRRLDLHGYPVDRAGRVLQSFLRECAAHAETCVLVVHGKGLNSPHGLAVLRPNVERWLAQHPQVAEFAPARREHGGDGATYVLLESHPRDG